MARDRVIHDINAYAQTHTRHANIRTQQRVPNIFVGAGCHSNRAELILRNRMAAVHWTEGREKSGRHRQKQKSDISEGVKFKYTSFNLFIGLLVEESWPHKGYS